jgi:beta-glucosidase
MSLVSVYVSSVIELPPQVLDLTTAIAYTSFAFSNLTVMGEGLKKRDRESAFSRAQAPKPPHGYFHTITGHKISVTVKNTGKVAGAEVAQLYLSFPRDMAVDFPPQQLRGFQKVFLKPGESRTVWFRLRHKDISYWNVQSQVWTRARGQATVKVASSSRMKGVEAPIWL